MTAVEYTTVWLKQNKDGGDKTITNLDCQLMMNAYNDDIGDGCDDDVMMMLMTGDD